MTGLPAPASGRVYWIVAVLALAWNMAGVVMFYLQVSISDEALAALPVAQQRVYEATPGVLNAAFGLAVFGGVAGALALLLRRRLAVLMFALSLGGLLVQVLLAYVATPAWEAYGPAGLLLPGVLVVAIALLRYAMQCARTGLLG